jgi:hypothetical protein
MRNVDIPLHELAFVAATRGLAGAGLGLLAAGMLEPEARKTVGWTLIGIGALSTVPLLVSVARRSRPVLTAPD